jgi:hypothetical protein
MPFMDSGNRLIWQALKLFLPPGTRLTSVRRPAFEQLAFIKATAERNGYKFGRPPILSDGTSWQGALEFIRSRGYKVAAPGTSMHQRGLAYDLAGPNLALIESAVRKAVSARRIRLVPGSTSSLIVEPHNGCVHVEIQGGLLDFEPFELA